MFEKYLMTLEELTEIADEVKLAVLSSLANEGLVNKNTAYVWAGSHEVQFELKEGTEDKDQFRIKVVSITAG